MLRPNFQFCGIQGSGKGTQSRLLAASTGYTLVSTGQLLRQSDSPLIIQSIAAGELVSDQLVYQAVNSYLSEHEEITGLIGDGMIRRASQVELFEEMWQKDNYEQPFLIELHLSKEQALERILKRGEAEYAGKRSDTSEAAIKSRIQTYFRETQVVIDAFKSQGRHVSLDATQSIDTLAEQILAIVRAHS